MLKALLALHPGHELRHEDAVREALRRAAERSVDGLVVHEVRTRVNRQLVGAFRLGAQPDAPDAADALRPSIEASIERVNQSARDMLEAGGLVREASEARAEIEAAFANETWDRDVPGRDTLKAFAAEHVTGVRYEQFRNLIIREMIDAQHEPDGMRIVLDQVLAA